MLVYQQGACMTVHVRRDRFRQAILAAVADKEMLKIIELSTYAPKSVNAIIRETEISHSTAYRKIRWMLEEGILYTEKIEITPDGKKFSLFRSTLRSISFSYVDGKTSVEVDYNIDVLEKTAERLFSLEL